MVELDGLVSFAQARVAVPLGVPVDELAPGEAGLAQGAVIDQDPVLALGDRDDVVQDVAQDDLRLGPDRGEDQVAQLAATIVGAGQGESVLERGAGVVLCLLVR